MDDIVSSYPVVAKTQGEQTCKIGLVRWSPVKTLSPGTNGCDNSILAAAREGIARLGTTSGGSTRHVERQR